MLVKFILAVCNKTPAQIELAANSSHTLIKNISTALQQLKLNTYIHTNQISRCIGKNLKTIIFNPKCKQETAKNVSK